MEQQDPSRHRKTSSEFLPATGRNEGGNERRQATRVAARVRAVAPKKEAEMDDGGQADREDGRQLRSVQGCRNPARIHERSWSQLGRALRICPTRRSQ